LVNHVFVRGVQSSMDWIVGKVCSFSMGFGSKRVVGMGSSSSSGNSSKTPRRECFL
jgi:hypothetical protein